MRLVQRATDDGLAGAVRGQIGRTSSQVWRTSARQFFKFWDETREH